ncbi:MAG: endopeptidase [Frankiaceae bacterium]|nr:endopeptidase [Frankiaceae bacterium]
MCLLLLGFAVLVIVLTPWHPLPGPHVPPDPAADFTPAQIARETAFHDDIRPWGLTGLFVGLLVPAVVGFTSIGARLIDRLRRRRWIVQVVAATIGMTALVTLVSLPIAAREHVILRRFGLSTQGWSGWWSDVGRGYAVGLVTTLVVLLVVMGLARRFPRRWWIGAASIGAALVVGGSFAYPVVVEPVFNNFHSLPAGDLRTEILAMAVRDQQPLDDVLVADASRRTTAENAYVSGFGASRRLVLDDTLLAKDTPAEVLVVAAHELGHAKNDDVLTGTIEGALAVAAAMCALFLLLGDRVAGARSVPLLLAAYVVVSFAVSPLSNLISRHVEARADAHALALTRDPETFVQAQRDLALSGLDDLRPSKLLYVLFFTHPSTPERIAMARQWERQHAP